MNKCKDIVITVRSEYAYVLARMRMGPRILSNTMWRFSKRVSSMDLTPIDRISQHVHIRFQRAVRE